MKGTGNGMGLRCPQAKQLFSPYLDGAVTGTEMLVLQQHFPRHGTGVGRFERCVLFVLHQPIQAYRMFLPQIIDGQIPRYGVKPRAEFVFPVVLMPALQHANPGFLEEVLGQFTIS